MGTHRAVQPLRTPLSCGRGDGECLAVSSMTATAQAIITLLGAVLVYLFGRWQGEHQLLYQERVNVIKELFARFEEVERRFSALFAPLGGVIEMTRSRLQRALTLCRHTTGGTASGSLYASAGRSATF